MSAALSLYLIRLRIVRFEALMSEFIRERVATLSEPERTKFSRMADPGEADVRAVLRAESNELRARGHRVCVAHAGRFGVLVESADVPFLGVDVEPVTDEIPDSALVADMTLPEEYFAWSALPKSKQAAAFLRLWTLKEAGYKARPPISYSGLRTICVSPDFLNITEPGLTAAFIQADPGHVVAVAYSVGATVSIEAPIGPASF